MSERIETLLAQSGYHADAASGAVIPPIHLATTFERTAEGDAGPFIYSRAGNPTRTQFEDLMARLEGGHRAFAFSSGMAAIASVFQLLEPGAHVVLPDDLYYGVRQLLEKVSAPWKVTASFVDMGEPASVAEAIRSETRMIWMETPSNPLLRIADIQRIAAIGREHGLMVAIDGTWTTPLLQRPLDLGATIVIHSVTKYLAGHSDVLGGAVVLPSDSPVEDRLNDIHKISGAVMDPFSAWLTMRGMRTLSLRLRQQCDAAEALAHFLNRHPRVTRVHFPGLPEHPGYQVAMRQMRRPGAMLSFEIDGGAADARRVATSCRVFRQATSLGGTESLIEHRASVEADSTSPPMLLRVSSGIEHVDDLLEDLSSSLAG